MTDTETKQEIKETKKHEKEKDNKNNNNFLDDKTRENIKKSLKDNGIESDNLSDNELLEKFQTDYESTKKIKDDLISSSQDKNTLVKQLNSYINTHESLLTDKVFVTRLFDMGVPACFLKLFRDADTTFTNSKIWEIIRHSGINVQEYNISEVMSRRRNMSKNAKQILQNRLGG